MTLLVLTVVVPGTAQLAAGDRRLGPVRAAGRRRAPSAPRLLVALLALVVSRSAALTVVTHRWTLAVLAGRALSAFAVLWAVLLVDAWRLGRPGPAATARPPALAGGSSCCSPRAARRPRPTRGRSVGAARAPMASVFATGEALGAVDGRYNILLLGGDSGVGPRRHCAPTASSSPASTPRPAAPCSSASPGRPRTSASAPGSVMAGLMPEGWTCGDECLLNGLYTWGTRPREASSPRAPTDPGLSRRPRRSRRSPGWTSSTTSSSTSRASGASSTRWAASTSPCSAARRSGARRPRSRDGSRPGEQHLDGYHALWYARSRANSTNYERMARQRCVVTAMVRQLDPQTVVLNFADIAPATKGVFRTDIPQEALASLADLAVKTKQQKITSVNFVPPLIKPWGYDPRRSGPPWQAPSRHPRTARTRRTAPRRPPRRHPRPRRRRPSRGPHRRRAPLR